MFQGADDGAFDGIFQGAIDRSGQLQACGFRPTFFIGAAGGMLQADAAIFPQLVFLFEAPGGVQVGKEGDGADGADAG